ncbi:MAG: pyruvate kinase [Proteobacteria bacterium]|nr:pyruvate kinase [Pseudomonadota bacterium]
MSKLTKITASIGPKSEDYATLKQMIEIGVAACRLNFSHDTGEVQGAKFNTIRRIASEIGRPVAIIADMQGPKHRIGDFANGAHPELAPGAEFVLDNDPAPGDATRVYLPDDDVLQSLRVGERVLLNDGKLELEVTASHLTPHASRVTTRVVRGGEIWDKRGFNLPDTTVATSVLTDKDRADLEYALTKNPDYVAISFVQKPEDIAQTRDFITARTNAPVKIVAKIERPQAVARIEEIAAAADAIMVARGDLAVEMPYWQIPAVQRRLIRVCRRLNRPVIIATQMLASMAHSEFPMRAEISDVATAAYLRADSTMTSEETTIGDNPIAVTDTMAKILAYADEDSVENTYDWSRVENIPENDWSRSVASMAYLNKATAIVVFDRDGEVTTQISCRRPDMPIVAVCNTAIVANQLCLCRGVFPIYDEKIYGQRDTAAALAIAEIPRGKTVVVDGDGISLE